MENTVMGPKESFNIEPEKEANREAIATTEVTIEFPSQQNKTGDPRDENCDEFTEHVSVELQHEIGDIENNSNCAEEVDNDDVGKLNAQAALIEKNRTLNALELKRQADTMLSSSTKKFPLVTVGQNVILKIPEEDRGRVTPRNIMAMVIFEENGFYKLGTANGVLEKMYTRNEFQLSQSEFLTAKDVPSTSFPMRQIAAKESRSKQGCIRCNSKVVLLVVISR